MRRTLAASNCCGKSTGTYKGGSRRTVWPLKRTEAATLSSDGPGYFTVKGIRFASAPFGSGPPFTPARPGQEPQRGDYTAVKAASIAASVHHVTKASIWAIYLTRVGAGLSCCLRASSRCSVPSGSHRLSPGHFRGLRFQRSATARVTGVSASCDQIYQTLLITASIAASIHLKVCAEQNIRKTSRHQSPSLAFGLCPQPWGGRLSVLMPCTPKQGRESPQGHQTKTR